MRKIKILTISLCVSIMLCLSIGLFSLGETPRVYAEGNTNYFTVEEYTDYDELLRSDGTSSDKDIQTFAREVKEGKSIYYPELAEVIPRQYLESQDENATFAYNGKEYSRTNGWSRNHRSKCMRRPYTHVSNNTAQNECIEIYGDIERKKQFDDIRSICKFEVQVWEQTFLVLGLLCGYSRAE